MRYKEFNSNKVLEKCILLFWNNGFTSCSINDVVKHTQVNRYSLYNEYTNKEGILLEALKLYKKRYSNHNIELLKPIQNQSAESLLMPFFKTHFTNSAEHPPGCFILHIATELADSYPQIKEILASYLNVIENKFFDILNTNDTNTLQNEYYAKHLVGLFCNSMCYCMIQPPQEQTDYVKTGIEMILNSKQHGTNTN